MHGYVDVQYMDRDIQVEVPCRYIFILAKILIKKLIDGHREKRGFMVKAEK